MRLSVIHGFGILLILLALFDVIGKLYPERRMLPMQLPSYVAYSVVISATPAPFIALLAAFPIFIICRARCRVARSGSLTAVVVILITAVLIVLGKFNSTVVMFWCLPALLVGSATHSSFGFYVGALLQITIGAWLVFWFHHRKSPDGKDAA